MGVGSGRTSQSAFHPHYMSRNKQHKTDPTYFVYATYLTPALCEAVVCVLRIFFALTVLKDVRNRRPRRVDVHRPTSLTVGQATKEGKETHTCTRTIEWVRTKERDMHISVSSCVCVCVLRCIGWNLFCLFLWCTSQREENEGEKDRRTKIGMGRKLIQEGETQP